MPALPGSPSVRFMLLGRNVHGLHSAPSDESYYKTEVQSVIARRRSCTDSKDPDAAPKEGQCRLHLHTQHARPSSPSPRLLSAILPLGLRTWT